MSWVEQHPLIAGALVIVLSVIVGGSVVLRHTPLSQSEDQSGATFGSGAGVTVNAPETQATPQAHDNISQARNVRYIPVTTQNPDDGTSNATQSFQDQLSSLFHGITQTLPPSNTSITDNSFDTFLPTGVSNIDDLTAQQSAESSDQKALRQYGDRAGTIITAFENSHTNQPQIVQAYADNPTNQTALRAQQQLGADYDALSKELSQMSSVPPVAAAAHQQLVLSYSEIGQKLAAVAGSKDIVTAMETYNAAANMYVRHFVALALLFPAYNVTFAQGEAGTLFQFSGV